MVQGGRGPAALPHTHVPWRFRASAMGRVLPPSDMCIGRRPFLGRFHVLLAPLPLCGNGQAHILLLLCNCAVLAEGDRSRRQLKWLDDAAPSFRPSFMHEEAKCCSRMCKC